MRRFLMMAVVLLVTVAPAQAGRIKRVTETVTAKNATRIDIDCDLGAGEFNISTDKIKEVAVIDIAYDQRAVRYDVDYYERGGNGYLTLESDHRKDINFDTEENRWDITLSTEYEIMMNMDIGACVADFELGGLPLKELNIDVGASSGLISFNKPNPSRLAEIQIDVGASSLEMVTIGNANFAMFDFSGGVGSFDLDFRGDYRGESEIRIEIGLGTADIVLPQGVPIRVETKGGGWLSSIDFHNDDLVEIDSDLFESEDFEQAKDRIILSLEVGLGSVDLYWRK